LLPQWSRLQDVLSADVAVRGTALAAGGLAAVLADLHPQVRLVGASILVGISHTADVALAGRGLTLLPTAWGGGVGAMWDPPWQPALTYPARGTSAKPVDLAPAGCWAAPGQPCSLLSPTRPPPAASPTAARSRSVPSATTSPRSAQPASPPPTASATPSSTNEPTSATRSSMPPQPAPDRGPNERARQPIGA